MMKRLTISMISLCFAMIAFAFVYNLPEPWDLILAGISLAQALIIFTLLYLGVIKE